MPETLLLCCACSLCLLAVLCLASLLGVLAWCLHAVLACCAFCSCLLACLLACACSVYVCIHHVYIHMICVCVTHIINIDSDVCYMSILTYITLYIYIYSYIFIYIVVVLLPHCYPLSAALDSPCGTIAMMTPLPELVAVVYSSSDLFRF